MLSCETAPDYGSRWTSPGQRRSSMPTAWAVLCGAGSALFWAFGFVAARHGILAGVSPLVLALHRFIWPGLALIPVLAAGGFANLGGMGWRRGIAITVFGGLPLALWSYIRIFVRCARDTASSSSPHARRLAGLILARLVLKEAFAAAPRCRRAGDGSRSRGDRRRALGTMGSQGFSAIFCSLPRSFFAVFGMLLRLWRIPPTRAMAVTSVLSLAGLPIFLFAYQNFLAAGLFENLLQQWCRAYLPAPAPFYLFTRAVIPARRRARGAVFPRWCRVLRC